MTTSTDYEAEFLAEIEKAPEDMVPRLVFADWLDDNGRPIEAIAWRWLAEHEKRPTVHRSTVDSPAFNWWAEYDAESPIRKLPFERPGIPYVECFDAIKHRWYCHFDAEIDAMEGAVKKLVLEYESGNWKP